MTPDEAQERKRLAESYGGMADEELRAVAADPGSLTDEAREALNAELARRDMVVEAVPDPGLDVAEWDELIVVRQFRDLPEALLAKGLIDSAGIQCCLVDEHMVRIDWFISNLLGGVKLCVHEKDEEEALSILEQASPPQMEVEGVGTYTQPLCPHCGSADITFHALNRVVSYGSAYFGVPIPLKKPRWVCAACGHKWREPETPDAQ